MMINLHAGSRYMLDGKQVVTIVRPSNKLATRYVIETENRSVMLVEAERLIPVAA